MGEDRRGRGEDRKRRAGVGRQGRGGGEEDKALTFLIQRDKDLEKVY